jgi:hypothetical protein
VSGYCVCGGGTFGQVCDDLIVTCVSGWCVCVGGTFGQVCDDLIVSDLCVWLLCVWGGRRLVRFVMI